MAISIHDEQFFGATPEQVYEALMDSDQHANFTGSIADISREVGGSFSAHNGYITGINVQLIPNERIVQAWRAMSWADGEFSIVRYQIIPDGVGTKLILDHTGFPEGNKESLASGWAAHYWEPMRAYFG
jgi:activator of HSP90 ATPase